MHLQDLQSTTQLKELSVRDLEQLAEDMREAIVETVATNGGHLGPNLGTVELALALHSVFDSPTDKILWDVSHQSYPHKLLTGRFDQFKTLRQAGGIAGFTRPSESDHDHFYWGHASTSVSAGLGLAKARDLSGDRFNVVAVIGDGALTGGLAYEALDYGGQAHTKMIVVLNDNAMSIAPNVGGISQFLARIRSGSFYGKVKRQTRRWLKRLPVVGDALFETVDRLKESIKHFLLPNMLFEELGWTYIGPIPGHNISALQEALQEARALSEPVVVHVVTAKGKGYEFAEENPDKFHGCGPFAKETGQFLSASTTYSTVFGNTMVKIGQDEPRLVCITAAMASGTGSKLFAAQFNDRHFDVGIAEAHAVSFAAGQAKQGMRPVVALYSTFLQRAYDQIVHDVALQGFPVVLAVDRAGLVEDGPTHHGVFDISCLRSVPGLVLAAPKDENELQHMLYTGVRYNGGPFALRYPRATIQGVLMDEKLHELPIGKAEVLREGSDVLILALGVWASAAVQAAEDLDHEGIKACVVNPRWVKPLDEDLICALAMQTRAVLTVEEGILTGGFGSAVMECLADRGLGNVMVHRIGVPDRFIPHGDPKELQAELGLSRSGIVRAGRELYHLTRAEGMAHWDSQAPHLGQTQPALGKMETNK